MKTLAKATLNVVGKLPDTARPPLAYLKQHWQRLGGELAANSVPHKLGYRGAKARLTLACSGSEALRLQHLKPQLLAAINRNLEAEVIAGIDFVHQPHLVETARRR